jgi:hypothetical protein
VPNSDPPFTVDENNCMEIWIVHEFSSLYYILSEFGYPKVVDIKF